MGAADLTNVTNAQAWVSGLDSATAARLISTCSNSIQNWLGYTVVSGSYNRVLNGNGRRSLWLPDIPVTSISSLVVDTIAIPAGTPPAAGQAQSDGFYFEAGKSWSRVDVSGRYFFCRGLRNVAVAYTAGYAVQGEAQSIPDDGTYQVQAFQPNGVWMSDLGVAYANGVPFTSVSGPPSTGQYTASAGVYTFSSGDAGSEITISYGYIPFDIEQGCLDMIKLASDRISRSANVDDRGAGSIKITYTDADDAKMFMPVPTAVRLALSPYKNVLP